MFTMKDFQPGTPMCFSEPIPEKIDMAEIQLNLLYAELDDLITIENAVTSLSATEDSTALELAKIKVLAIAPYLEDMPVTDMKKPGVISKIKTTIMRMIKKIVHAITRVMRSLLSVDFEGRAEKSIERIDTISDFKKTEITMTEPMHGIIAGDKEGIFNSMFISSTLSRVAKNGLTHVVTSAVKEVNRLNTPDEVKAPDDYLTTALEDICDGLGLLLLGPLKEDGSDAFLVGKFSKQANTLIVFEKSGNKYNAMFKKYPLDFSRTHVAEQPTLDELKQLGKRYLGAAKSVKAAEKDLDLLDSIVVENDANAAVIKTILQTVGACVRMSTSLLRATDALINATLANAETK